MLIGHGVLCLLPSDSWDRLQAIAVTLKWFRRWMNQWYSCWHLQSYLVQCFDHFVTVAHELIKWHRCGLTVSCVHFRCIALPQPTSKTHAGPQRHHPGTASPVFCELGFFFFFAISNLIQIFFPSFISPTPHSHIVAKILATATLWLAESFR